MLLVRATRPQRTQGLLYAFMVSTSFESFEILRALVGSASGSQRMASARLGVATDTELRSPPRPSNPAIPAQVSLIARVDGWGDQQLLQDVICHDVARSITPSEEVGTFVPPASRASRDPTHRVERLSELTAKWGTFNAAIQRHISDEACRDDLLRIPRWLSHHARRAAEQPCADPNVSGSVALACDFEK